ncbi:MAG TPA: AAA family ATPase [Kofleriaceae bacterium]
MATAHLIYGRVGAGKTTYGRQLATQRGALFFCLDEWMANLYMMDAPVPITLEWALPRTERAEVQISAIVQQALALEIDVVLELGFFRRAQRDRARTAITGGAIAVHVVEAPIEVRRERVRARNRGSATFTVEVDDAMFDWAEQYFEDIADDER